MKYLKTFESSNSGISTSDVYVVYRKGELDINYKIYLDKSSADKECDETNNRLKSMTGFAGPVENYFYSVFTLEDALYHIKDAVKDEEVRNSGYY